MVQTVKRLPAEQETRVPPMGQEDPLEEEMATPLQDSCLENPVAGGAWWAAVCGVAQSWTQLKRLSSSSSRSLLQGIFPTQGSNGSLLHCRQILYHLSHLETP